MVKGIRVVDRQKNLSKNIGKYNNIVSTDEFRALLAYERSRSERSGSVFSVAVFGSLKQTSRDLNRFMVLISRFTRSIDRVGWDEKGLLSVLLPDTNREGASLFVKKISRELAVKGKGIEGYQIFSYPEQDSGNQFDTEAASSNASVQENSVHDYGTFLSCRNAAENAVVETSRHQVTSTFKKLVFFNSSKGSVQTG